MILSSVYLSQFRNFEKATFEFSPRLTIIVGENAHGKTSLLEAVYFSVFGIGFRESREEELLRWEEDQALVETVFFDNEAKNLFQIMLHRRGDVVAKRHFVNKTEKPTTAYQQFQTRAVLFAPEHIEIVNGSPDKRREYFNRVISAFDLDYQKKLRNYENALRKRNKIFEIHRNESALKEELEFWNNYLIEQANYITSARQKYVDYLNDHPSVEKRNFRIEYLKNEFTLERLVDVYEQEKRMRRTVIGPQKDDFIIFLMDPEEKNVHHFGSRSEQRLAVFWLKLNEINNLEAVFNRKPILLLDDVFSELDNKNKKLVMDVIDKYQTIITTTEGELVEIAGEKKTVIRL